MKKPINKSRKVKTLLPAPIKGLTIDQAQGRYPVPSIDLKQEEQVILAFTKGLTTLRPAPRSKSTKSSA